MQSVAAILALHHKSDLAPMRLQIGLQALQHRQVCLNHQCPPGLEAIAMSKLLQG